MGRKFGRKEVGFKDVLFIAGRLLFSEGDVQTESKNPDIAGRLLFSEDNLQTESKNPDVLSPSKHFRSWNLS